MNAWGQYTAGGWGSYRRAWLRCSSKRYCGLGPRRGRGRGRGEGIERSDDDADTDARGGGLRVAQVRGDDAGWANDGRRRKAVDDSRSDLPEWSAYRSRISLDVCTCVCAPASFGEHSSRDNHVLGCGCRTSCGGWKRGADKMPVCGLAAVPDNESPEGLTPSPESEDAN